MLYAAPLLALSTAALLCAQNASVSGTVVNDATGAPLHMAMVVLSTNGAKPMDASVYTDGKGAFSFEAPPGNYYLYAAENGYEMTWFGAPTTDRAPAIMTLHAGERRQGIQLRLRHFAAISGVVVDQDNDPIANVQVGLAVSAVERGKRTLRMGNSGATNAKGEFRIHHVAPGRYYLVATAGNGHVAGSRAEVAIDEPAPAMTYTTTFYPGTSRIESATALDVRAGAELRDVMLHMEAHQVATVSGKVELPEGFSMTGGGLIVNFQPDDPLSRSSGQGMGMGVQPDGSFGNLDLMPGRYRVIVTAPKAESEYRGVEVLDLQPGPQALTLHLSKGVALAGRLVLEGPDAGDPAKEQVTLVPAGEMMPPLTASVKADGSFEFPRVFAGVWDIGVSPVPKGGFVKSMMLGSQDVLTEEMNIGPQTREALNIVISSRGGVVSGTVKQALDPLADLTGRTRPRILLAPTGKFADVLSFFEFTAADENGHYELIGVTPGDYKLFAFDRMERGSWQDPDFMKRIDALGKPVAVHEGERVKVDIDVVPVPPGGPQQ